MPTIQVSFKVPFECNPSVGTYQPILAFYRWLPIGREKGINIYQNDIFVCLWFDCDSIYPSLNIKFDDLKDEINVWVGYINIDIKVDNVSEDLIAYTKSFDYSRLPDESERDIHLSYTNLIERIVKSSISRVNRLIAFARSNKQQFWLTEYNIDTQNIISYFKDFNAICRVDSDPPFLIGPKIYQRLSGTGYSPSRYITEADWPECRDFVSSNSRTDFIGELLARAESFFYSGNRRSALIDLITAIELVLDKFGKEFKWEKNIGQVLSKRIETKNLCKLIDKLGISGSINYLLPILLPEEILPTKIIQSCRLAIQTRNSIIHHGQRDVDKHKLFIWIKHIREFCQILKSLC
ncbi:hypothetical protein HGB07_07820 [Candidatus Roizmanbacteria bacterium]|nr:hypothetical protein [Candidatus Roizmanbacteria bacterium]